MKETGEAPRTVNGRPFHVLRSPDAIGADIERIAGELRGRMAGRVPVFIAMLKGSFVFLADLVRAYREPHEIDFLAVTRYDPARKDPASVRVMHDLSANIAGRSVVVVEAIRTRGHKIEYVDRFLRLRGPEEILYAACVRQRGSASGPIPLHSWGFEIDDRDYVVGYGLDLDERYRNLPYIGKFDDDDATGRAG